MKTDIDDETWRTEFTLTSEARSARERRALALAAERGELERVVRGVYTRRPRENGHPEERHLDLVRAQHLKHPHGLLFSHRSAAALWGLPRLDAWPTTVEVTSPAARGGRSEGGIRRFASGFAGEADRIGGLYVTPLPRTVIDVARIDSVASAVSVIDAALAGIETPRRRVSAAREVLAEELASVGRSRGTINAAWALEFADAASESPGESLSRVQIERLGLARPKLQFELADEQGRMFADFCWPEFKVVGEFDGFGKYLRRAPEPGESVVRAVMEEKAREDRIRALGWTVVRWMWATARDRRALEVLLRRAGVR